MSPVLAGGPGRLVDAIVPKKRRGVELALLLMALVLGVGSYALVGLGTEDKVPSDIVEYGGGLVVLALACHLVVRFRAPYADPVILPCVVALNGIGLAMIHRIDLARTAQDPQAHTYATQQLIWTTLSVIGFVATMLVVRDHRILQAFTYTMGFAGIALLLLPLVPGLGVNINGARIWIRLGGLSFQPGEVAKLCLAIFFAGYLVVKREALALAGRRFLGIDLPRGRDLGPIAVMWLISLGILVFEDDLGSSLLFFGLFVMLLYVATERPSWLVVGAGLFAAGAYASYLLFAHVQTRVEGWLHPFSNTDSYYQIVQGQYGMAWGGILGRGWGQGSPQLTPLRVERLHRHVLGRGARSHGADGDHRDLLAHRRARSAHRIDLPRPVRKAARRRALDGVRAAGLRGPRRRHEAHPAHRAHHPVPVLRRLRPDRQLGDGRPRPYGQQLRTTAGARARRTDR